MEYTYDDIITAKDILTGRIKKEDIIGKSGWFMDCIPYDMSLSVIARIGTFSKLISINPDVNYPFDSEDEYCYIYFLPEKKVLAPKEPTVEDFSIGDRVILLSPAHSIPEDLVGKEGRIVSKGIFYLQLMFDGYRGIWGTEPKYLKKIEDNALKQVESIPESQLSGYHNSRKPEYVPFDLSREEDRQLLRDTWIKSKYNDGEARVSAFKHIDTRGWLAHIPQTGMRDGEQLFNSYTFLDGSPCGRQITSK